MAATRVTICNKKGLHARAAAKLVKLASSFDARVEVVRLPSGLTTEESRAGATSILGLLMLAAEKGADVELHASGTQAEDAVAAITALIERKFEEDE